MAAFVLLPLFVLITRRVGRIRRELAASTQISLADISSLVEESLSVSGVLLAEDHEPDQQLATRFRGRSDGWPNLQLRQRMAEPLGDGVNPGRLSRSSRRSSTAWPST